MAVSAARSVLPHGGPEMSNGAAPPFSRRQESWARWPGRPSPRRWTAEASRLVRPGHDRRGCVMLRRRGDGGNPDVRLTLDTARELLPLLSASALRVGLFSGFFGIGGGFLIVPGLILATGMPLQIGHRHVLGRRQCLRGRDSSQLCRFRPDRLAAGGPVRDGWASRRRRWRKARQGPGSPQAGSQRRLRQPRHRCRRLHRLARPSPASGTA